MKRFLSLWVWQFPQMLLGTILVKKTKAEKRELITKDGHTIVWYYFKRDTKFTKFISGASFAAIILLSDNNCNEKTICHEYGHSRQSEKLGPLYLVVIGLPSSIGNLLARVSEKVHQNYYRLPWERWADILGGVARD